MYRLRLRSRGLIPDIAFAREPANSTGGTFTLVDASFFSAHPNSEVGYKNEVYMRLHMRGSGGFDSNLGEVKILQCKIIWVSGMCFSRRPHASEVKSTDLRAARPQTAPPKNTAAREVASCR
jgi:hypothetical protein